MIPSPSLPLASTPISIHTTLLYHRHPMTQPAPYSATPLFLPTSNEHSSSPSYANFLGFNLPFTLSLTLTLILSFTFTLTPHTHPNFSGWREKSGMVTLAGCC